MAPPLKSLLTLDRPRSGISELSLLLLIGALPLRNPTLMTGFLTQEKAASANKHIVALVTKMALGNLTTVPL